VHKLARIVLDAWLWFDPERNWSVHRSNLLDHFIGGRQQRRRHIEAERSHRRQVEDELEFARLYHRQIGSVPLALMTGAAGAVGDLISTLSRHPRLFHERPQHRRAD
jgi:hypothetical protein